MIGVNFAHQVWRARIQEPGVSYFWKSVLASENPALIVIGVHSLDEFGKDRSPGALVSSPWQESQNMLSSMIRSDMVPVSDIVSYSELTRLLTLHGRAYRTQGAPETTFGQLQRGPVILIGGFDNVWTLRLTSNLRYRFDTGSGLINKIVDSSHPGTAWIFDNAQSAQGNSRDYAIVASYFDPQIEERVLIAAGIGKSGTAAAAEFLSSEQHLKSWLAQNRIAQHANVEILISTEIVEGQQGPPRVVASYTW